MKNLSQRLKVAREHSGLSQGQVAKMLQLHRPTISEIEAGRRKVSAEELSEFARIYEVNIGWLTNTDEETNDIDDRVRLAARDLQNLKPEDLERVLRLLSTIRAPKEPKV